jgi:hypothetical protein
MARQGQAAAQAAGGPGGQAAHAGLGMVVVMTGVPITAVDTTIVVLALPEIERDLHVALASVIWVISATCWSSRCWRLRWPARGHVRPGADV